MPARSQPISFEITSSLPFAGATLVGRTDEQNDISRSVASARLVTLTGPGGVGKSHLALAVAQRLGAHFPDGIGWVDLTAARDGDTVRAALGEVLGDAPAVAPSVTRRLRRLIVLDGCEHAAEAVAELLGPLSEGGLCVLATSLLPLKRPGELVERIRPLAVPEPGCGWDAARRSAAVRLFLARMLERATDRTIDEGSALAICEICRRLEGLPLSIELAAERAALLGPHAIRRRLDRWMLDMTSLRRDCPVHQHSLRVVGERALRLLAPFERLAFCRLSVIGGGFSFGAAHAVVADLMRREAATADLLEQLITRSLLQAEWTGEGMRYCISAHLRSLALQELDRSGELEEAASRQLGYLCRLARHAQTTGDAVELQGADIPAPELTGLLESMLRNYGETRPGLPM